MTGHIGRPIRRNITMNVKNIERNGNQTTITVEIDKDLMEKGINAAYLKARKQIMIPGFRKGKAPRKMIEAMYGAHVFYEDGLEEIFPEVYQFAVVEQDLKAIGRPSLTDMDISDDDIVTLTLTTELYPEVTLGQYKGLEAEKKTVEVTDEDVDKEKVSNIVSESKLIICLDFNKLSRTEWMEELIRNASATKVLIVHHIAPDAEEFDLVLSQPESSSTCELLFRILMSTSFIGGDAAKLPYNSRLSLATGLITDTNNFSNSLTPTTFETASKLLESGIDFNYITNMVQKRFSEDRIRLMGHLMSKTMITYKDLNAACTILTLEDKAKYNFQDGDSEGFVNIPLSIDDVEVSGFFSESKDGYVKVSLRSKNWFSSNRFSNPKCSASKLTV